MLAIKFETFIFPFLLTLFFLTFLAPCGSGGGGGEDETLDSLAVTPADSSLAQGETSQLTATGTYSDGTTDDLTLEVSWESSNTVVASINEEGVVTAAAAGETTITAASDDISGSTNLTVVEATLSSIAITPADSSTAQQTTVSFTATGTFSNGIDRELTTDDEVTWSSSSTAVATIDETSGIATAVAAGSTTITATSSDGTTTTNTTLTVTAATLSSINVTPDSPSKAQLVTTQFTATGTFSDNTTLDLTSQVTWSSSSTEVATINSSTGLATAVASGSTTITATSSGGISAGETLTITTATLTSIQDNIFTTKCATCHSGGSPPASLNLASGNSYGALVGVTAGQCIPARKRVTASDTGFTNSYLVDKLNGTNLCAGTIMPPQGSTALTANQIQAVKDWITAGALNN